jgi:hypothetical protein
LLVADHHDSPTVTSRASCSVHRYYDPAAAVFLSVDPIVDSTQQPYGYANDDPLNGVDLTGLCAAQAAPPRQCGGVIETPWGSIVTKVRHESSGWSLRWQINLNAEIRAQLNGSWIRAEAITTVNNRYISNFGSHSPEPPY